MKTRASVSGMQCASCVSGIERFLRSQNEIQHADVDYDADQLTIEHSAELDLDGVWQRIQNMGYNVEAV